MESVVSHFSAWRSRSRGGCPIPWDIVRVEAGLVVWGGKLGVTVRVRGGREATLLVALLNLVNAGGASTIFS